MATSHSIALGLYKMQHPKLLTLCWRSFSQWGCDHVGFSFAHKSCWYVYYRYMPEHSPWILHDATPKIVDALLTLCWCSVHALLMLCWRSVDALLTLYWRSVDALLKLCWRSFSDDATSKLMLLPIKAAKTFIMGKSHSIALGLHKMQHLKSLTLCWRSLSQWGGDHVACSFEHRGCRYVEYAQMS